METAKQQKSLPECRKNFRNAEETDISWRYIKSDQRNKPNK